MAGDRRRNRPRRKGRLSPARSQRSPSRGRQRTASASRRLSGPKGADQPAATPNADPYLYPDGHEPAKWLIPPVVASRFGLPVRFPALWNDAASDRTFVTNLHPTELWEALFATLWRLVKQKDHRWAKRIEPEIEYRVLKAGKNPGGLVEDLLTLKRIRTGRPRGSGSIARVGNKLPVLHMLLSSHLRRCRTRERRYTPVTLTNLENWWEEWRDIIGFPVRDFPQAEIQGELDAKSAPADIADIMLARAFRVTPDSVRARIKKALRRIPESAKAALGLPHRSRKFR